MSEFYDPVAYDARTLAPPGDVEFYVGLAREADSAGQPVLELACGTGRVTIPIARSGVCAVGLDLSPAMLLRACDKSAGLPNVRWVEGDMRAFELPERVGLALIPFRSFQHLLTIEDQLACLACIHRHLLPGGRLAINLFNPDLIAMAQWLTTRRGGVQRRSDPFVDPRTGRAIERWESRVYKPSKQETESTIIDEALDEDGVVVSRVYRGLRLRYLHRYEAEHLFARAGFEIEALYGDFLGGVFEDASPEMVWVLRKV